VLFIPSGINEQKALLLKEVHLLAKEPVDIRENPNI
jgi:hypothetical protein